MKQRTNYHAGRVFQCTVLLAFSITAHASQTGHSDAEAVSSKPRVADIGILQLKRGYPELARNSCEMALKTDPKNEEARKCLDAALVALEARDAGAQQRTLAQAESLLHLGKKTEALAAVEKIQSQIVRPALAAKAQDIIERAGELSLLDRVRQPLSFAGLISR